MYKVAVKEIYHFSIILPITSKLLCVVLCVVVIILSQQINHVFQFEIFEAKR